MCALPVAELAAKDSALFMWATFPQLPEALRLIRAWGFTYKSVAFVWLKKNRKADSWFYGLGFWTRANAEICLLATKGHPKRQAADIHQFIISPIEAHSKKPDETRDMEIIGPKGTLTGEDIKADQCYLLLAYLILNHKKNFSIDTLAEIICPYDELDSPYKVVNNIVYRLRRTLSVIGLDKLVIGKNGTFQINPDFNIHTDFDRFENACIQLKTEENPDMRHSLYHSAVDMYKGQLLPRCEHELWLMQLSMYYQSLYLQITKGYVRLKMECKDYILAQKTAIDALRFDPKDSELNMYAILAMGFQGNLSMAQTYYTAAKPYLALEHAEVIKKYLNIK